MTQSLFQIDTGKSAIISPCGRYRYRLERFWSDKPRVCWIMLNPSTADAQKDDPTIRRITDFTHAWGYGGLVVVNLFALRSTSPAVLHDDPAAAVGPENDAQIKRAARDCNVIVAAWGVHGSLMHRDRDVLKLLRGREIDCLGLTSAGHPRHPLYISAAAQQIVKMVEQGQQKREAEFNRLRNEATKLLGKLQKVLTGEELNLTVDVKHNEPFTVRPAPPIDMSELTEPDSSIDIAGGDKTLGQRILNALAWWEAVGIKTPTRQQVAFVAKVKPSGGYYARTVGETKTAGLIDYPTGGTLRLTAEGHAKAVRPESPPSYADLLKRARSVLDAGLQQSIFDALVKAGGPLTREELAAAVNVEAGGGYFARVIGTMKTSGIIRYPSKGSVALGDAFTWKE